MLRALKNNRALRRWFYTRKAPLELKRFRADLSQAIRINRASLALIPRWLDESVYRSSIFQYGLPEHIRAFIDDPIDSSPTYTDLITALAARFGELHYLELGTSVGKNIFQVVKSVDRAELTAIDIEDINPVLSAQLVETGRVSWPTMANSTRPRPSTQITYQIGTNRLDYIAGDLFDPATWDRLKGKKFNLIFSDAFHSPDALIMEWERIAERRLLADGPFAMLWDDLNTEEMRDAFYRIASVIKLQRPALTVSLELFQGWVGKREAPHLIGIVNDLRD